MQFLSGPMQSTYGHPIGSSDSGHPICLEGPCPRYKLKVVGKPSKKLGFPINGVVAQPHNCGAISQIPLSKCSFWLKKNWMYPHYRSPGSWQQLQRKVCTIPKLSGLPGRPHELEPKTTSLLLVQWNPPWMSAKFLLLIVYHNSALETWGRVSGAQPDTATRLKTVG